MPDEPEKAEDTIVTQGADKEPQTVPDDELQGLRAKEARLDKMDEIASEMFHDNAEAYMDTLEQSMAENTETPAPEKPPETPAAPAAPANNPEYDKVISQVATNTAATAMEAQWTGFEVQQMKLPEKERSSSTREDLLKILKSPKGLVVKEMAGTDPDLAGNLFLAADYFSKMTQGKSEERKAGAASEKALNAAKTTASLEQGVSIPTLDSNETEDMAAFADMLSPPDEPIT